MHVGIPVLAPELQLSTGSRPGPPCILIIFSSPGNFRQNKKGAGSKTGSEMVQDDKRPVSGVEGMQKVKLHSQPNPPPQLSLRSLGSAGNTTPMPTFWVAKQGYAHPPPISPQETIKKSMCNKKSKRQALGYPLLALLKMTTSTQIKKKKKMTTSSFYLQVYPIHYLWSSIKVNWSTSPAAG